jgi:hypothetical protein
MTAQQLASPPARSFARSLFPDLISLVAIQSRDQSSLGNHSAGTEGASSTREKRPKASGAKTNDDDDRGHNGDISSHSHIIQTNLLGTTPIRCTQPPRRDLNNRHPHRQAGRTNPHRIVSPSVQFTHLPIDLNLTSYCPHPPTSPLTIRDPRRITRMSQEHSASRSLANSRPGHPVLADLYKGGTGKHERSGSSGG